MALYRRKPQPLADIRTVDGDTIVAWIQIEHDLRIRRYIRLVGVEGGEIDTPAGKHAAEILRRILERFRDSGPELERTQSYPDRYGRTVGDLVWPDGTRLTDLLIESGAYRRVSCRHPNGEQPPRKDPWHSSNTDPASPTCQAESQEPSTPETKAAPTSADSPSL